MSNTRIVRAAVVASALFIAEAPSQGAPLFTIDQQNLVGGAFNRLNIPENLIFGQSFTATRNGIDAVEMDLAALSTPNHMRIALLDGVVGADGMQGAVLERTAAVLITDTTLRRYHFDFPTTIPLIPGKTYVLSFELGQDIQVPISDPPTNPYSGGQALTRLVPMSSIPNRDYVFFEGLHRIPEPGSVGLVFVALMCAGISISRRR
jgi:hypothetical protein